MDLRNRKEKIRDLYLNKHENTTRTNLWPAARAVLIGNFITLDTSGTKVRLD